MLVLMQFKFYQPFLDINLKDIKKSAKFIQVCLKT